ncbi:hypothetical protein ZEAMMB73_Zm00001d044738 [Zea mays]|uniref:Uncharacterized protein n=1 Tax=Zea mays TaxID=4577 RepID=A0A1D6NR07_MAIZE|nr:hypothetical protein ZEAMMB73_Zm00001d044738 [Zea mays]
MDPLVILKSNEIPLMDPLVIPVHQINPYTAVCDSFSSSKFSKNGSTENALFAVLFVMEGGVYGARGKSHILVNHHLLQPVNGWLLPMELANSYKVLLMTHGVMVRSGRNRGSSVLIVSVLRKVKVRPV